MKNRIIRIVLRLFLLVSIGLLGSSISQTSPANAQGVDLDAILARSAVKGYLTSLQFRTSLSSGPSTLINFYLSPDTIGSPVAQNLQTDTIETFQITDESWFDDDTYQVTAEIMPGDRMVVAHSEKVGSRWRITSLAWASDVAAEDTAAASTDTAQTPTDTADTSDAAGDSDSTEASTDTADTSAASADAATDDTSADAAGEADSSPAGDVGDSDASGTAPIIGTTTTTGDSATVEVLAAGLNLRAGPGVVYDSIGVVTEGEQFDVTGINSSSEWYQIATDDEVVGWISSDPPLVAITPEDAEPPTILVPRLSPSSSASSSTSTTSSTTTTTTPATTSSPSTTSTATAPSDSATDTFILQTASGGEFYLVRPATGEVQLITSGIDPAFSPDMSQIAFTRWTSGGAAGVMLYDLASGTERQIIGETKQAKSPTWSPDGSKLMVSFQNGGRPEIESVCKERGGRIPREAYDIQIGSDTGRICYKLPADPYWQLREIVVATGEYQDMASATYSYAPTWDPINDWRVVFAGEDGLQQLDVNRNEYFTFTENLRDRGPVFSPDGQWVAVTYRESNAWHIQIISTTDGTRQALTTTDALADEVVNNAAPAWSPDSSQLAFVTDRNGEWEFYVMNIDSSDQQPLLSPEIAEQIPVQYNGVDERLINWR